MHGSAQQRSDGSAASAGTTVRSIDVRRPDATKALAQWCQSVQELHTKSSGGGAGSASGGSGAADGRVMYSKRMPNVETLMGVWDNTLGLAENEYVFLYLLRFL